MKNSLRSRKPCFFQALILVLALFSIAIEPEPRPANAMPISLGAEPTQELEAEGNNSPGREDDTDQVALNKAATENNAERIKDNTAFIRQFLTVVVGAAIASRLIDEILSERRKESILASLKANAKEEVLPELVQSVIDEKTKELNKKYTLLEQEMRLVQYELLDLYLAQNEKSVFSLDESETIRQVEYNLRAIEILHKIKRHAKESSNNSTISDDIDLRISLSLQSIFSLLQGLRASINSQVYLKSSELFRLRSNIYKLRYELRVEDPDESIHQEGIGEIIQLIDDFNTRDNVLNNRSQKSA